MDENSAPAIATLQRQVAEMMRLLKDEKTQHQEEKTHRIAAEERLNASIHRISVKWHPTTKVKMCTPDKFDGTMGNKAETYFSQVALYIQFNIQSFPTEQSKVTFALSYLTGYASIWAQPFTEAILSGREVTFLEFTDQLKAMFFDSERQHKAQRKLCELRQTGPVDQYTQTFLQLARASKWCEEDLIDMYQQGPQKEIRLTLLTGERELRTLQELSARALKVGAEFNEGAKSNSKSNARISELEEAIECIKNERRRADLSKNGGARD